MKKLLLLAIMPLLLNCSGDDNNSVQSISDINFTASTGYSVYLMEYKCTSGEENPVYEICVSEQTMNEVKNYVESKVEEDPDNMDNYCPAVNFTGVDGSTYTGYAIGWGENPENECMIQN